MNNFIIIITVQHSTSLAEGNTNAVAAIGSQRMHLRIRELGANLDGTKVAMWHTTRRQTSHDLNNNST